MSDTMEQKFFEGTRTALFVRGALAIIFAIVVVAWPSVTVLALVFVFGIYAVADGVVSIVHFFSDRPRRSGWTLVGGIVSILAGIVAFVWPGITALSLTLVIGAWALILGITQIALSFEVKKTWKYWWMWLIIGLVTAVFGVYVLVYPGSGIISLLGLLATFAFVTGVLLVAAGFQLRSFSTGTAREHHGHRPTTS